MLNWWLRLVVCYARKPQVKRDYNLQIFNQASMRQRQELLTHTCNSKDYWFVLQPNLQFFSSSILSVCQTCLSQVSNKRSQDPRRPSGPWGASEIRHSFYTKVTYLEAFESHIIRKYIRYQGRFKTRFTSIQNGRMKPNPKLPEMGWPRLRST